MGKFVKVTETNGVVSLIRISEIVTLEKLRSAKTIPAHRFLYIFHVPAWRVRSSYKFLLRFGGIGFLDSKNAKIMEEAMLNEK